MRTGHVFLLSLFLLALVALGCDALTTESETDAGPALPSSVSMDPGSFLTSGVMCAELPGAMQSYVATITDVTDAHAPFTLPSSPPLSCTQSAYFEYIGLNRVYTGVIDGYLEAASELVPVCGIAPAVGESAPASGGACAKDDDCLAFGCFGTCAKIQVFSDGMAVPGKFVHECQYTPVQGDRNMLARKNGQPVYPRWTTEASEPCGHYPYDAVTMSYDNTALVGCGPLEDAVSTAAVPTIELDPQGTLGGCFACSATPTPGCFEGLTAAVTTFDVTPAASNPSALAASLGVACAPNDTITWKTGIVPYAMYEFTVQARVQGSSVPTQQAYCFAGTDEGVTLAECDPLVPIPCSADTDCTGGDWCDVSLFTCMPKLLAGAALPADPPHTSPTLDGTCTSAAAVLVCQAGVCEGSDSECGLLNGHGPCTTAEALATCQSGVCDPSDAKCGLANGDGPCTSANGSTVCRSGTCGSTEVDAGPPASFACAPPPTP